MFSKKYRGPLATVPNTFDIKQATDQGKITEIHPTQNYQAVDTTNITLLKSGTFLINHHGLKDAKKATNGAIFKLLELLRIPPSFAENLSANATSKLVNSILQDQARLWFASSGNKITSFGYTRPTCPANATLLINNAKEELGLDFVATTTDGEHTMTNFMFRKYRGSKYRGGITIVSQLSNVVMPMIYTSVAITGYQTSMVGEPIKIGTKDNSWIFDQINSLSFRIDAAVKAAQEAMEKGSITRSGASRINAMLTKQSGIETIKAGPVGPAFDILLSHMKTAKNLSYKIAICFAGGRLLNGLGGETKPKPAPNLSGNELADAIN